MAKEIVVPGEFLSFEEEFMAGKNAFEDDEGNVFSSKLGVKELDEKEREVSVKELKQVNEILKPGNILFCQVALVKESFVVLSILSAENNGKEMIVPFASAKLMISNVSRSHINFLSDAFRTGDLVKVKVTNITKYGIDVTTSFPELGVIRAFCTKCRGPLGLYDKILKCPKCGSIEKRKLSTEFK